MGFPGKLRPSRQKLALIALLVGSMTLLSQSHASFRLLLLNEQDLDLPSDLVLPSSSNYGAWSLTLQLLTPAADLIKEPQNVTRELERVVSHAVSTHGLRLLGLTTIAPSRSMTRGLKSATFSKRTSSQLLIGSAIDDEESLDDVDVETVNGVEKTDISNTMSLFMRAIIASTQPSSDSVAALVHLAKSGEIFSWTKKLKTAGLPIDGIEIVSLAPHAPNSVEAKLQAQLLILHEEMSDLDSFEDLEANFSGDSGTTFNALSSTITRGIVSLALVTLLVGLFVVMAIVQGRKNAARAAAAAAASETFIRKAQNNDAQGAYSKLSSTAYC
ncbi:hypothetical protein Ndes2526B_g04288 [Nannochloris sp. 'desiccata']